MAEPVQAFEPEDRVRHPSGDRATERLVFDVVRRALRRYPLLPADRDDLTQKAVETAFARWDTYRSSGGTLRAWLGGIVRNEVRHFHRTHRRREHHEAEHARLSIAHEREAETPEDKVCIRDLFDHLIVQVPVEQRRILILVELADHTIREAAAREGISHTTAHARHQAGMRAFVQASERWREEQKARGVAPLPLSVEDLLGGGRSPDHEDQQQQDREIERWWADAAPESGPRPCGPYDDPPPSSDPRSPRSPTGTQIRWQRWLGILTTLGGSLWAGVAIGRCSAVQARSDLPATAGPSAPIASTSASTSTGHPTMFEPAIAPRAIEAHVSGLRGDDAGALLAGRPKSPAPKTPAPKTPAPKSPAPKSPAPKATTRSLDHRLLREELILLDRARAALEGGQTTDALVALDEHVRRFPVGDGAAARERLRIDANAR